MFLLGILASANKIDTVEKINKIFLSIAYRNIMQNKKTHLNPKATYIDLIKTNKPAT